jgi:fido (protein-threonine AMPylation protein)
MRTGRLRSTTTRQPSYDPRRSPPADPFPNGNGRHARLAADLLAASLGGVEFRWGRGLDLEPGELRATYIAALQAADAGDPADLLVFARA